MILLVNDAGILIDLLKIDLIEQFFQLENEFHITDFVRAEIHEINAGHLDTFIQDGKLIKMTFSFDELGQIQLLEVKHRALSIPDCSCLYLSELLSAALLTGDGALRKIAEQNKVPVHGILWVFDELVRQDLISPATAHKKLKNMMSINSRLPVDACNKRLTKWKKG